MLTIDRKFLVFVQNILGIFQVVSAPEAVVSPTTPATDDNLKYWIIGVVCGVVILLSVIGILICWRWIRGGPKKADVPTDHIEIVADETDVRIFFCMLYFYEKFRVFCANKIF